MAVHYTCDRCGLNIEDDGGVSSTVDTRRTGRDDRTTYELCAVCDEAFEAWVKRGVEGTG